MEGVLYIFIEVEHLWKYMKRLRFDSFHMERDSYLNLSISFICIVFAVPNECTYKNGIKYVHLFLSASTRTGWDEWLSFWEYMERHLFNSFIMKQSLTVKFTWPIWNAFYSFHMDQGHTPKSKLSFSIPKLESQFTVWHFSIRKNLVFVQNPIRSIWIYDTMSE